MASDPLMEISPIVPISAVGVHASYVPLMELKGKANAFNEFGIVYVGTPE